MIFIYLMRPTAPVSTFCNTLHTFRPLRIITYVICNCFWIVSIFLSN